MSVDVDFVRLGRRVGIGSLGAQWFSVDHKEFLVVVGRRGNGIQRGSLRGVGFSMGDR